MRSIKTYKKRIKKKKKNANEGKFRSKKNKGR